MLKIFRENSLSIVAALLFAACLVGQALVGRVVYNEDAAQHGAASLGLWAYLGSGDFIEAVFENWESEFLQMALFVVLTRFLRQKGSSESKSLNEPEEVDVDPRGTKPAANAPWPVRRGGVVLTLYEHSLSVSLLLLFALSFVFHVYGGMLVHNENERWHGGHRLDFMGFLRSAELWQQSLQNWQSEFLSVAVLVVLTIFLRERGSAQSKPVAAPFDSTD
jgi:hypothetical protein